MTKSWTRIFAPARVLAALGPVVAGLAFAPGALADAASGPQPWQIYMQPTVSSIGHGIRNFNTLLTILMGGICLLVIALVVYCIIRFRASKNPVPSRTSHNTVVEVTWTLVPILILMIIAVPSFRLLYAEDRVPPADMTVKVTGHQWYWTYDYPDNGEINFDSLMVADADLKPGQKRLLETDNHLVVPVNTTVRVLVTASDVMHAWYIPALGVQMEAVPGRSNETWFNADKVGTYYGQCTELCGLNHGFMPIVVDVVSKDDFKKWVVDAKEKFALNGMPSTRVAQLAPASID